MPSKIDILKEAHRRGILPPDKKPLFDEAVKRGLIKLDTTEQKLREDDIIQSPQQMAQQLLGLDKPQETGIGLKGAGEAALTVATGAIAEPIAGLGGIATLASGKSPEEAARIVEETRQALTFTPKSEKGKKALQETGDFLKPMAELFEKAEKGLGDRVMERTNSPALAALSTTLPTLATELIGVGAGKAAISATKKIKNMQKAGKIAREIKDAVPTKEKIKQTSRAIFKEIDETGAIIKEKPLNILINLLESDAKKAGLDIDITPKSNKAIKRFAEFKGKGITTTDLDTLRKVAQNAAKSIESADAAIGVKMVNTIDDFLDNVGENALKIPEGKNAAQIGKKYKIARNLWGRAKRSELLEAAFETARNQASGFENGLRTQFRQILNNKRKRKFFNDSEIKAMNRVVRGDTKENIAKLIGKLGLSEGGATQLIGTTIGIGLGATFGGTPGAIIVPLVGQVSKKLAQRMTRLNAEFADSVIRAGKDAKKITEAYIKHTPENLRNPSELSQLLMRTDIALEKLPNIKLAKQAKDLTLENRALIGASVAAPEIVKATQGP